MAGRKHQARIDDVIERTIDIGVDAMFDRLSDILNGQQQVQRTAKQQIPAEARLPKYKCAGCHQMFTFDQCAMVGAKGDGFGVCERCFHFMWHAANEKVRAVRDGVANAAKNAARQRQTPAEPARPKPWDVLGVAADASEEEIKKAYRKLAAMTHPDRVPPGASDEEREAARAKFEEITRCYDVMMKVRKKASA